MNDNVRRKLARKICEATSIEERRKYAKKLSQHLDRDSGWHAPVSSSNKSFHKSNNNGPATMSIENMDPIESRRFIKKATKDLERRTILRLKEDRMTKAILRSRGTLQPVQDNYQQELPPPAPSFVSPTLMMSPEPRLSSHAGSQNLQQILLEMQENPKSDLWQQSKTNNNFDKNIKKKNIKKKNGNQPLEITLTPLNIKKVKDSMLPTSRSRGNTTSRSASSFKTTRTSRSSGSTRSLSSNFSSCSVSNNYDKPYLRHAELAGVSSLATTLRPGVHFYSQFLKDGGPCHNHLHRFKFPDTLVRFRLKDGTLKWLWLERGQETAQEIPFMDRPLSVQREHIIRRLAGSRTTSKNLNKNNNSNYNLLPVAIMKVCPTITPSRTSTEGDLNDLSKISVLHEYDELAKAMSQIFTLGDNSKTKLSDIIVLQKYVGGDSGETSNVIRVVSKCGHGKPTVFVHHPSTRSMINRGYRRNNEDAESDENTENDEKIESDDNAGLPTSFAEHTGQTLNETFKPNYSNFFIQKNTCNVSTYIGYPPTLTSTTISKNVEKAKKRVEGGDIDDFLLDEKEKNLKKKRQKEKKEKMEIKNKMIIEETCAHAIGATRNLVHLLSEIYLKLQIVELSCDYIYIGKRGYLIKVHDFKIKGPKHHRASSSSTKNKGNITGRSSTGRISLSTSRSSLTIRPRAQTASSSMDPTSLPLLLANANGKPVPLGGGIKLRNRPTTVSDYRRKKIKCSGRYCNSSITKKGVEKDAAEVTAEDVSGDENNSKTSMYDIMYKSIIEDRYDGRTNKIMTKDRTKIYSAVKVCKNCYVMYTMKDKKREERQEKASKRAAKMLKMAAKKYNKFTGNDGVKIKSGTSRVEKLYENSKKKNQLPPSVMAMLKGKSLSEEDRMKLMRKYAADSSVEGGDGEDEEEIEAKKEFEKEYSATSTMEKITFEQLKQSEKEIDENDKNVCLLCEEDVISCECNLSPRVDVRALIGRVVPDLFEHVEK